MQSFFDCDRWAEAHITHEITYVSTGDYDLARLKW
jgi:hypothetical protein